MQEQSHEKLKKLKNLKKQKERERKKKKGGRKEKERKKEINFKGWLSNLMSLIQHTDVTNT